MLCLAILIMCNSAAPAEHARPRAAQCEVWSGDHPRWRGPCLFTGERGPSFSIVPAKGEFPGRVRMISVAVFAPRLAEVRGLTRDGINSRWGQAARSRNDPACWESHDFGVCAR
jgi:hypothetical protein